MLVLWARGAGPRRVGIAVSRRVGGAVVRNRARRRLRESYRAVREAMPSDVVAILVAKRRSLEAEFGELVEDLRAAAAVMAGGASEG